MGVEGYVGLNKRVNMEDKDTKRVREGHPIHEAIEQGVGEKKTRSSDQSQVMGDEVNGIRDHSKVVKDDDEVFRDEEMNV